MGYNNSKNAAGIIVFVYMTPSVSLFCDCFC